MAKTLKVFIYVVIILLIVALGFFLYNRFVKPNSYIIENDYYGFRLQTPKGWVGKENTFYSAGNIAQVLLECNNDETGNAPAYEIGAFRFADQRYPEDLSNPASFPVQLSSGTILEITVSCVPDVMKNKVADYIYGNLQIAGENAFSYSLSLAGFGKTDYFSLFHNNFQYKISKLIYISQSDKDNADKIREKYSSALDKVISSLAFIK